MPLEIVYGISGNTTAVNQLVSSLRQVCDEGTLYIGYPIIASVDSSNVVEALLLTPRVGLVAFILSNHSKSLAQMNEDQDNLYYVLKSNLMKNGSLRQGRELGISPFVASFLPSLPDGYSKNTYHFVCEETMSEFIQDLETPPSELYTALVAAIQRITYMRPQKKREKVRKDDSKGNILKIIESEIANLDFWQKKAAIETPDGPQRVRGLAGSGKTIVLALKAAYLHAQHPDWDIIVTYNTRTLKQQFIDLIERFYFEHSGDKPDHQKLQIVNAWGSDSDTGVYSIIAKSMEVFPTNFLSAKQQYGSARAFEGVCSDLQSVAESNSFSPLFDAVLIDEAQDLPDSFLRLVYQFTRDPKRVVWAYDEMQTLSSNEMSSPEKIFGLNQDGQPLVIIDNVDDQPMRDIILPMCYRNTPWALTMAHGFGLGIYKRKGLVQMFDDLKTWEEIRYQVISGRLDYGSVVSLARKPDSYPAFFEKIGKEQSVEIHDFQSEAAQYEWVARQIKQNLEDDELDFDDIIVIVPDPYKTKKHYYELKKSLLEKGIDSNLSGVTTPRDVFRSSTAITVSSIYRVKGNEAPMEYVINAEWCGEDIETIMRRNVMFTAITRSRAWIHICGVGTDMDVLKKELNKVIENDYHLKFKIPTKEQLKSIKLLNQDSQNIDPKKFREIKRNINNIVELIKQGVLPFDIAEMKELQALMKTHIEDKDIDYV